MASEHCRLQSAVCSCEKGLHLRYRIGYIYPHAAAIMLVKRQFICACDLRGAMSCQQDHEIDLQDRHQTVIAALAGLKHDVVCQFMSVLQSSGPSHWLIQVKKCEQFSISRGASQSCPKRFIELYMYAAQ